MKIALIEAFTPERRDRLFYPLGLAYLGGYLKNAHPEVDVRICQSIEEVMDFGPDIAGISSASPYIITASSMARRMKRELAVPVILGGAHISTLPESLPESVDAGVIGEGELTFLELIEHYMEKGWKSEELFQIPGLALHAQGRVRLSPARPPLTDLDSIPFPMREWAGLSPSLQWMFSSRGCPYKCSFCSSSALWKGYRAHSPVYVASELSYLVRRFDMNLCIFMDDLFAVDLKRILKLKELIREKVDHPLQFSATIRAELASPEMCRALKEMGTSYVHLGLETGSDRILKSMKCTASTVETNRKALQVCCQEGLNPVGSFIIGAPDEGEEELEETYRFIRDNLRTGMMKSFSFSPLVPFPGTEVWRYAVARGLLDPSALNWVALDIDIRSFTMSDYVLLTDRMGREKFLDYFKKLKALYDEYCPA